MTAEKRGEMARKPRSESSARPSVVTVLFPAALGPFLSQVATSVLLALLALTRRERLLRLAHYVPLADMEHHLAWRRRPCAQLVREGHTLYPWAQLRVMTAREGDIRTCRVLTTACCAPQGSSLTKPVNPVRRTVHHVPVGRTLLIPGQKNVNSALAGNIL